MVSFAELKAKAAGATSSGVEKFHNVKDRHTSVPMAKTNWDPYSGTPAPPPPPPRSLVNKGTKPKPLAPLPPPPSRTSSAALSASSSRNNSGSPAPSLPSRSDSGSAPPLPPPRGKSTAPPAPPPRASASPAYENPPPDPPQLPGNGGPPPLVRSTRPDIQHRRVAAAAPVDAGDNIDWANLSPEDKQIFFSWLDEFFANFKRPTTIKIGDQGSVEAHSPSHGPPPLRAVTKPSSWTRPQVGSSFVLSHPPMTTHGSAALDLAYYFSPTTLWTDAWYNASGAPSIPPPLVGNKHYTFTSAWKSRGSSKTTHVGIFFSDLSVFWGTVDFTTTAPPEDQSQVRRSAVYLPPPKPLSRDELVHAHETYGDTIALYAESFLGSGQYCARGECWDLANESLKYFADYDYIPKPIPSISRTHGHLIFEGKASNGGREMVGRWRGGDDRIRRGDIVEWRKVKIAMKAAPPGSFYTLGDPDHTAVIVSDCVPSASPKDAGSLSPSDLGILVVIEQSQGQLPERREYDLSRLEEGEVWIYRPIGMKAYLGVSDLTALPPEQLEGLQRL